MIKNLRKMSIIIIIFFDSLLTYLLIQSINGVGFGLVKISLIITTILYNIYSFKRTIFISRTKESNKYKSEVEYNCFVYVMDFIYFLVYIISILGFAYYFRVTKYKKRRYGRV